MSHLIIQDMRILKVATCSLNQWAMDFDCNMTNIKKSITLAKQAGAAIRLGPELEITGYGCEDHFFELDTITHAWECLKELLVGDWTDGILCSFGMPIMKGIERYNCQVLCLNRKILMIRPKMWLANSGGYSELRWFTAWKQKSPLLDDFLLPVDVSEALSQATVPFGYGYLRFLDTAVAAEVCMELFSPVSPHQTLALNGVEVFMNASGSAHLVRKANGRLSSIMGATSKCGGVYMYSNQLGCDGGRIYFDGCSCVVVNGNVVGHGSQFSLKDVDLVIAQIDLDTACLLNSVLSFVCFLISGSTLLQMSLVLEMPTVAFGNKQVANPKSQLFMYHIKLCQSFKLKMSPSSPLQIQLSCPEEEIALGPACWLWNYLRRSGASGFLLPLSGRVDSSSVAAIVGSMCQMVIKEIQDGNEQVKTDAIRIGNYINGQIPTDHKEFAKRIFYTVFMGSESSSDNTRKKSKVLADEIGSWHFDVSIDGVISSFLSLFHTLTRRRLHYKEEGATNVENLALQNIQARTRMAFSYMLASLLPWVHNTPGFLLVLSSNNADEGLTGRQTKYGCSSGDINPIGNINKQDLRTFMKWASVHLGYSSLEEIKADNQNSDLNSTKPNQCQDEVDIGMTDEELSVYGRLRKISQYGPVSMFKNLCSKWGSNITPTQVAIKVKRFFELYSTNRHKMSVLTPSCLMQKYLPDDNRYDPRQVLYNTKWTYQFRKIDELVQEFNDDEESL